MSGNVPTTKKITKTSSSIENFTEHQQIQDKTILQHQSTSQESSSPIASSSTYIKVSTFSGPGGTNLINSPETPEKSEDISVYASPPPLPLPPPTTATATNTCTIFRDQIINDGVLELSTRRLDGAEEDENNNAKVSSSRLSSYVDPDYRFPAITEDDEPTTDVESSKPTVYREQYVYHLPPKSPVQTNSFRNPGNIVEEPASQKRKLDDNNSNEQDIDQQEEEQQERSFKRTKVTEEYDEQSNKEHDGLEGQDWKGVLYECIAEYRKHLDAEEKNLTMLMNILRRLQKLYALAVKSINTIDEDMQNSRQVPPSDALDKYNQFLFDAMATVNKDS